MNVEAGSFTDSEIIVMLGENGTGKTTFIRMLAGGAAESCPSICMLRPLCMCACVVQLRACVDPGGGVDGKCRGLGQLLAEAGRWVGRCFLQYLGTW